MLDTAGRPVKALFVAGLNLGTKRSGSAEFLEILRRYEPENIYLVGDMIGYREWKKSWHWPQSHNDVIQKLLRAGRRGTKVLYLPGDRDGFMRHYGDALFGGIALTTEAIHESATGKKLLVVHGDAYDLIAPSVGLFSHLGKPFISLAVFLSKWAEIIGRQIGFSIHGQTYQKTSSREARFLDAYAKTAVTAANALGVDGVICGHLPHAAHRQIDQIHFMTTGDWRISQTALVEHLDGRFEIIDFNALTPEPASLLTLNPA
jgi:UDP-2,3-diacylglucosamine pyrophosphatase LpxH